MRASSDALRVTTVACLSALAVASAGGALTRIGPWYRQLHKPAWTPPDLAFPIVWTTIFGLAAGAGAWGWMKAPTPKARGRLVGLFALNGILNAGWSYLFFTRQRPDWALVEATGLVASVVALVVFFRKFARVSSLLLSPYLLWVGVATALNAEIVRLNPPFR